MLQTTIQVLLDKAIDTTGHNLYVVKDGSEVLYVGQSANICSRIRGHMQNLDVSWSSLLGKAIAENAPRSYGWEVVLYTVDECSDLVTKWFPRRLDFEKPIRYAEDALIHQFNPCYNRGVNTGFGIDSAFSERIAQEKAEEERQIKQQRAEKRAFLVNSVCEICGEHDTWIGMDDGNPCGVIEGTHGFALVCHSCNDILNILDDLERHAERVQKVQEALRKQQNGKLKTA